MAITFLFYTAKNQKLLKRDVTIFGEQLWEQLGSNIVPGC